MTSPSLRSRSVGMETRLSSNVESAWPITGLTPFWGRVFRAMTFWVDMVKE